VKKLILACALVSMSLSQGLQAVWYDDIITNNKNLVAGLMAASFCGCVLLGGFALKYGRDAGNNKKDADTYKDAFLRSQRANDNLRIENGATLCAGCLTRQLKIAKFKRIISLISPFTLLQFNNNGEKKDPIAQELAELLPDTIWSLKQAADEKSKPSFYALNMFKIVEQPTPGVSMEWKRKATK
jgi:hypothetical protein